MSGVLTPPSIGMVEDLFLVRLLLPKTTAKPIHDDLARLHDFQPGEYAQLQQHLIDQAFVALQPRNRYELTETGRRRALQFLRATEVPAKLNWGIVIAQHLFPMAMGMKAAEIKRINSLDKLAAIVLKRKYELPDNAGSTVTQVLEALTCHRLSQRKYPGGDTPILNLKTLLRAVLSDLISSDTMLTKDQLVQQVPLYKTGVRRNRVEDFRLKLIRDWLANGNDNPAPVLEPSDIKPKPDPIPEPFDLAAFAETVLKLARISPPDHKFYDNKVFISALYHTAANEPSLPKLDMAEFKQHLIEANQRGYLKLVSADMVELMDYQKVIESATKYLNATFHFVLLEGERP